MMFSSRIQKAIATGFLSALTFAAPIAQGMAQIITLSDNNSIAQIDTGSSAGMFNWSVNGQNQLQQEWFWYRVGSTGGEAPINTISPPSITTPGAATLYTRYNNGLYGVEVDYVLTGFSPSSGQSHMTETMHLSNFSQFPVDFHFYQYANYNLLGSPGGDVVQFGRNLALFYNEAFQLDGPRAMQQAVLTPGANGAEAAFFPATLSKLNDANPDTLNDNVGPVGPGDVTWAFQWDVTLPAGADFLISEDKSLQNIPEPSWGAFSAEGLATLFLLLHRKKNI